MREPHTLISWVLLKYFLLACVPYDSLLLATRCAPINLVPRRDFGLKSKNCTSLFSEKYVYCTFFF